MGVFSDFVVFHEEGKKRAQDHGGPSMVDRKLTQPGRTETSLKGDQRFGLPRNLDGLYGLRPRPVSDLTR